MKTSTHQPLCLLRPDRRIKTSTLKIQSKSACPSLSLETRPFASWRQAIVMSTEAHMQLLLQDMLWAATCNGHGGHCSAWDHPVHGPWYGLIKPLPLKWLPLYNFIKMFEIFNRNDNFCENKGQPQENGVGKPQWGALTHIPLDTGADPNRKRCTVHPQRK